MAGPLEKILFWAVSSRKKVRNENKGRGTPSIAKPIFLDKKVLGD